MPSNFTRQLLDETWRPHKIQQVNIINFIQGQILNSAISQTPLAHALNKINKTFDGLRRRFDT